MSANLHETSPDLVRKYIAAIDQSTSSSMKLLETLSPADRLRVLRDWKKRVDSTRAFAAKVLTMKQLDEVAAEKARLRVERDRILAEAFRPTALARPVVAASGCRWPLWSADAVLADKLVCGHPREAGASYCRIHAALAYVPPEDRRAA